MLCPFHPAEFISSGFVSSMLSRFQGRFWANIGWSLLDAGNTRWAFGPTSAGVAYRLKGQGSFSGILGHLHSSCRFIEPIEQGHRA